jgi:hypothetical protein
MQTMKSCPYCGAEYTDDVISCPADHYPVGAPVSHSGFTIPSWLQALINRCRLQPRLLAVIRWYPSQPRKRKLKIAGLGTVTFLAVYILSTSQYSYWSSYNGAGTFQISKPPVFTITTGATSTWHVQNGINFVPNAGIVEFPIFPGYRAAVRYFTPSWWRQWRQYGGS